MSGFVAETLRRRHGQIAMQASLRVTLLPASLRTSLALLQWLIPVVCYALALASTPPAVTVPLAIPLALWSGSRLRLLGNLMHECVHATLSRKLSANRRWGLALATLLDESWKDYARVHLAHHRRLATIADPDLFDRRIDDARCWTARPLSELRRPSVFLRHAFLRTRWSPACRSEAPASEVCAALGLKFSVLVACAAFGQEFAIAVLAGYALPLRFVVPLFRHFSDVADHGGLAGNVDAHFASRNHSFKSPIMNELLFPNHDQWHQLHHLFPEVPAPRLRALSQAIESQEVSAVCTNAPEQAAHAVQGSVQAR